MSHTKKSEIIFSYPDHGSLFLKKIKDKMRFLVIFLYDGSIETYMKDSFYRK